MPWLERHQDFEVVSRDRASAYADAAKRALPHVLRVADRYHLVQNLREHLQRFLDRKRTCLPVVETLLLKAGLTCDSGSADACFLKICATPCNPSIPTLPYTKRFASPLFPASSVLILRSKMSLIHFGEEVDSYLVPGIK